MMVIYVVDNPHCGSLPLMILMIMESQIFVRIFNSQVAKQSNHDQQEGSTFDVTAIKLKFWILRYFGKK